VTAPLVELSRVTKSFGATRALDDVTFEVRAGEVHVLAGENGAGKSTLIRVLSGVITDFEGELRLDGQVTRLRDARDAVSRGIATIHQELSLVGSMTVAENLSLSPLLGERHRLPSMFSWVRRADEIRAAREILATMDLDIDPLAVVETLPLAAQQLLEIARALAQKARILILDEPTSALSEPEAERLLARVERLAQAGSGIVYISHRMEENDRLAHRITVLRDGRVVASRPAKDLSRAALVALMMGTDAPLAGQLPSSERPSSRLAPSQQAPSGQPSSQQASSERPSSEQPSSRQVSSQQAPSEQPSSRQPSSSEATPLLVVRGLTLSAPGQAPLRDVSFTALRGEILGIAGLRGSGASELLAALFGVHGARARADITLAGVPFEIASPARSIAQGLVYLASDRKKTVLPDLDITENITLTTLQTLAAYGLLHLTRESALARAMTSRLHVAAPSLRALARALSGGNQQKVALLRCLAPDPRVLLFDEPTRGVDIGAKSDIHRSLRALADEGKTILLATSELPELLTLCDRILVLRRGALAETLEKPSFSRDALRLSLDG